MAENSTPEERTEDPTERRMGELRKDGSLPVANDITQTSTLLAGFIALYFLWAWFVDQFKHSMITSFKKIGEPLAFSKNFIFDLTLDLLKLYGPPMAVFMGSIGVTAILAVMLQTNWNVKKKLFDPKFNQMNPFTGIKRIVSISSFMMTLKSLGKLLFILPIGYFGLAQLAPSMVMLMHTSVTEVLEFTGVSIWDLFWQIMYILIVMSAIDFFWTKYQWLRQNRMTKDEVKDERKSMEGDETTKRAIQAKGLNRIAQRIRDSVPQADVVITNPTHYAIAIKYDRDNMNAPKVVAKGRGFLALRIREIAKESRVPILERKLLARALYASTEVGSEIPHELFRAVAEVLAYVYRMKTPYGNVQYR
ncbi:MAG: EscU/YscU/HrcU family type III secretion system export apparatus switch protein [Bdellovibrionales bacterium]|nr:EscU/YscU/HrcU family type III secretion system export apparatus switch protein [Bdellovibrionales bacterium]